MNPPTISDQDNADLQLKSHFMWFAMRYACLPLKLHKRSVEDCYEKSGFAEAYGVPLTANDLKVQLVFLSRRRIMLGRSVQPIGKLTNLAPIIGAIRLKDRGADEASKFLAPLLVEALKTGDSEFLNKVRKLSQARLGESRHYQIWVAIFELRNSGEFGPSKMLSECGNFRLFPNTKEIKAFISRRENRGQERFSDLPEDEATLSKLITSSGAKMFVEKALRGPAVRH